jgi:Mce-associated membrane protein
MRWATLWRRHSPSGASITDGGTVHLLSTAVKATKRDTAEISCIAEDLTGQQQRSAPDHARWRRMIAYVVVPVLIVLLAGVAGVLVWQNGSNRVAQPAGAESLQAATDGTVALLSYRPDTVEKDLETARSRLTGSFLDAYSSLIHEVVIPGSKEKQISAAATVPAAASIKATGKNAVVLVFVNQAVTIGKNAPTSTASSVRVTLDRIDGRWLISGFDPI